MTLVVALSVGFTLPALLPVTSLTQPETDILAAGSLLGRELRDGEGPLTERLKRGFEGVAKHSRVKKFSGKVRWMRNTLEPPLPRWVAGVAIAAVATGEAGEDWSDLDRARWAASLSLGLALALLLLAVVLSQRQFAEDRRALAYGGWAVVLALCLPGVVEAGTSVGYGATLMAASAGLLLATGHAARGGSGIWAGVAWALCLASHPSALFFLVPMFVAVAIGQSHIQSATDDEKPASIEPGHFRLPWVPISALAIPVVGALVVVLIWPSLWSHSGRGLAVWLSDLYRVVQPDQVIGGHAFGQATSKTPSGWAGLVQFVGWVPLPLLLAWAAGVVATIRKGLAGDWFPILLVVTVLVIAASAGGLFFGRMSLLPMLWAPVAVTAVIGVRAIAQSLYARRQMLSVWRLEWATWGLVAGLGLAVALNSSLLLGGTTGAEARQALPVGLIEVLADETPRGTMKIIGGGSWRRSVEVLASYGRIPIRYENRTKRAQWVVVVDDVEVRDVTDPKAYKGMPKGEPVHQSRVGRLSFKAYKR